MRVPLKWLTELVDVPWDASELATRLTLTGVAVETVEDFTAGMSGVVAARVTRVVPHPQSSRLWVCQVHAGDNTYQVVTGWPGIAEGQVVAFAPPGAVLPKGWHISEAVLAGVKSQGMLCAATEMLLGEPHREDEGVLVLSQDVAPGTNLSEHIGLADKVLVLDLTPNYGHCLSMIGVAQEVSALTGSKVRVPTTHVVESTDDVRDAISIDIEAPDLCPRYVARVVRGVKVGPSPLWLQARLLAAGMRPINNIVDITNYVMLMVGQPLHAFDYDRIAGRKIIVRRAGGDKVFTTLDGQERTLSEDMLVIADLNGPVAIAGVMGGLASEVTPGTVNVLIESALFDPKSIRRTSTALGLRSEASLRFEKGIDPLVQVYAADLAASMMCSLAGGLADRGLIDANYSNYRNKVIALRTARVRRLLGLDISDEEIVSCLNRLGFEALPAGEGVFNITVPSRRVDIEQEVDLIEEVGRIQGYDKVPATLLDGGAIGVKTPYQIAKSLALDIMAGLGLEQVITFSFISPKDFERCRFGAPEHLGALVIRNPLAEEQSVMRQSLLPGLLTTLGYNVARQVKDLKIYELGTVFLPSKERLPDERQYLSMVATGLPGGRSWEGPGTPADFFYAKGILESFLRAMVGRGADMLFTASDHPTLHPYRQAAVWLVVEGRELKLGHVGEIHPDVASLYGVDSRVAAFEIDLMPILLAYPFPRKPEPIPRFPGVSRDIALVVPDSVTSARVRDVLRELGGALLESIELFDVYRGPGIPEGCRSLAFSMLYRAQDRTLTDREVDELHERVRSGAAERLGASVR